MSADEAPGEILLSRERLAALAGFTEFEADQCEQSGVIHKTDGGYRGVELVKLQIVRQVAEQHGGLERVARRPARGRRPQRGIHRWRQGRRRQAVPQRP